MAYLFLVLTENFVKSKELGTVMAEGCVPGDVAKKV
jgi:hypothetical protein